MNARPGTMVRITDVWWSWKGTVGLAKTTRLDNRRMVYPALRDASNASRLGRHRPDRLKDEADDHPGRRVQGTGKGWGLGNTPCGSLGYGSCLFRLG